MTVGVKSDSIDSRAPLSVAQGIVSAAAERRTSSAQEAQAAAMDSGPFLVAIAFGDALRRHDAGAARSLLEPGARVLTADGTEVSDTDSIAFVLARLTAPGSRLTAPGSRLDISPRRTLVNGDVALCTQGWRLRAASDHPCFERASSAFFVLRRSDRGWRIAIAAPWG